MATDGTSSELDKLKARAADAWGEAEDYEAEAAEARDRAEALEEEVIVIMAQTERASKCGRCKRDMDKRSTFLHLSLPAGVHSALEVLSATLCWPCAEAVGFDRSILLGACRDYGR